MDQKNEIDQLLDTVIREGGSDLHLSAGRHPTLRVSGVLLPLARQEVLTSKDLGNFLELLLSKEAKERFLTDKEVDFSYSHNSGNRFRGSAYYQQGEICIALRLIQKNIRTLAELGLPTILETFSEKQQGFFLVVGPVGHGKSTTLAALIDLINSNRAEHIITIEDPIEYIYEQKKSIIDQREVRLDTKDFHTALISMFRQDVDVVLVGEMRGQETIATAVTAAETGHLVLSTLHTNNAAQTISRIIDSFPPSQQDQIRIQLANSLTGIFSQRLVPRVSGGLVPAYELLINNAAVSNLIRENRVHEINTVIETSSQEGMIDLNHCLADLVSRGEITVETAYQYSANPKMLQRLI
jgi:twitching motility protein PilT